jgi:maleylpyruvate isomerase
VELRVEDADRITAAVRPLQERLCRAAARLSVDEVRAPSKLPGWTRGHVLTHIARNAGAHVGMLTGVLEGERVPQYPGGAEQRAADIEAGAHRPVPEIVRDLCETGEALSSVWRRMTPAAWAVPVTSLAGEIPAWRTAWSRWREVEIHWVDLDVGVVPDDWSSDFVQLAAAEQAAKLADRLPAGAAALLDATDTGRSWRVGPDGGHPMYVVEGTTAQLLGWLLGRLDDPAAVLTARNGLPDLPDWG